MPVVTISRQFGAGGLTVAGLVADQLDAEVVDKELIAEVARRLGVDQTEVEAEDERPRSLLDRLVRAFAPVAVAEGLAWNPPYPGPGYDARRAIVELTQEVIREVARSGNAVIVGRGAPQVLAHRPGIPGELDEGNVVFLVADESVRACAIMEREMISEAAARRRLHEVDANRRAYLRQVYGVDWQDPTQYCLVLNTGLLGAANTARLILAAV